VRWWGGLGGLVVRESGRWGGLSWGEGRKNGTWGGECGGGRGEWIRGVRGDGEGWRGDGVGGEEG